MPVYHLGELRSVNVASAPQAALRDPASCIELKSKAGWSGRGVASPVDGGVCRPTYAAIIGPDAAPRRGNEAEVWSPETRPADNWEHPRIDCETTGRSLRDFSAEMGRSHPYHRLHRGICWPRSLIRDLISRNPREDRSCRFHYPCKLNNNS